MWVEMSRIGGEAVNWLQISVGRSGKRTPISTSEMTRVGIIAAAKRRTCRSLPKSKRTQAFAAWSSRTRNRTDQCDARPARSWICCLKTNAVRASHPDRIVRGFPLALSPHGGGTTASARQRIKIDQINRFASTDPNQ